MVKKLADWQLPSGVSRATWDYVNDPAIATEYDSFHATHGLLQFDQTVVQQLVDQLVEKRPATVVDLGCGTARSLLYAHAQGHKVIGVDLSQEMLRCASDKLQKQCTNQADCDRIQLLHTNMVETSMIPDNSVDLALCLYSSLGMVRGAAHRNQCIAQVHRFVVTGGRFLVHVHNRGNWWTTSNGRGLVWKDWKQRLLQPSMHEAGDRYYSYRNLPQMFLHIFSRAELHRLLKSAGFSIERWIYLDQSSTGPLLRAWFLPNFRSAGFLVVAQKSA